MTAIAEPPPATMTGPARPRPRPGRKIFRTAGPAVLVAAIFGFAVPRFGSYRSVWASMNAMTWPQVLLVAAAAAASMASAWVMICSVLPSIRLREAAVVNLGSNAVANTLPAGGALAMGVSWAMLSSWGISTAEYVLYTLVSGIWNVFARLGLPVLALLVLATASLPGASLPGRPDRRRRRRPGRARRHGRRAGPSHAQRVVRGPRGPRAAACPRHRLPGGTPAGVLGPPRITGRLP